MANSKPSGKGMSKSNVVKPTRQQVQAATMAKLMNSKVVAVKSNSPKGK